MSTKHEMVITYEKWLPYAMVTGHNSCLANKKNYISVFTWLMTAKLDKVMAYGIEPPYTKLHDSLITSLYVVSQQIKNIISPILQVLWTPNLTG